MFQLPHRVLLASASLLSKYYLNLYPTKAIRMFVFTRPCTQSSFFGNTYRPPFVKAHSSFFAAATALSHTCSIIFSCSFNLTQKYRSVCSMLTVSHSHIRHTGVHHVIYLIYVDIVFQFPENRPPCIRSLRSLEATGKKPKLFDNRSQLYLTADFNTDTEKNMHIWDEHKRIATNTIILFFGKYANAPGELGRP